MNRDHTLLMSAITSFSRFVSNTATRAATTLGIFAAAIITTLALALLALPESLLAQPALPGEPPPQAPIGPGLGALAVAGGAYAMRRLRSRKDGESQEDAGAI